MRLVRFLREFFLSMLITAIGVRGAGLLLPGIHVGGVIDALTIATLFSVLTYVFSLLSSSSFSFALFVFLIQVLAISIISYWYSGFTINDTTSGFIFTAMIVLLQIFAGVKRG